VCRFISSGQCSLRPVPCCDLNEERSRRLLGGSPILSAATFFPCKASTNCLSYATNRSGSRSRPDRRALLSSCSSDVEEEGTHSLSPRLRDRLSGEETLLFSSRSVEPALFSCSNPHSRISSPILPSVRFSSAANSSSSARKSRRTRRLIGAFHSPIGCPLVYASKT